MTDFTFRRKWREIPAGKPHLSAGITAGAVAAIVAALVNLPLEAPSDTFFNSASVAVGSLAVGLGAGLLRRGLDYRDGREAQPAPFLIVLGAAFVLVFIMAVIAETQMDRAISYIVPLAAIVFGLTGSLTLMFSRDGADLPRLAIVIAVVLALGIGIALSGQGDHESGRLELPPRTTSQLTINSA